MALTVAICSQCGAKLTITNNKPVCEFCGTPFLVKDEKGELSERLGSSKFGDFEIIGDFLERYRGSAENVVVPKGVTEIGENAFLFNKTMRTVVLPEGLEVIGASVFAGCPLLEEVTLPDGVKKIGGAAFSRCSRLKRINFPDSIEIFSKKFGSYLTFTDCDKLTDVEISDEAFLRLNGDKVFEGTPFLKARQEAAAKKIAEQQEAAQREMAEQQEREKQAAMDARKAQGLCRHCGGKFSLGKKCKNCGQAKDY